MGFQGARFPLFFAFSHLATCASRRKYRWHYGRNQTELLLCLSIQGSQQSLGKFLAQEENETRKMSTLEVAKGAWYHHSVTQALEGMAVRHRTSWLREKGGPCPFNCKTPAGVLIDTCLRLPGGFPGGVHHLLHALHPKTGLTFRAHFKALKDQRVMLRKTKKEYLGDLGRWHNSLTLVQSSPNRKGLNHREPTGRRFTRAGCEFMEEDSPRP